MSDMDIDRRKNQLLGLESSLFDHADKISKNINGKSDYKKDIRYTTYNTLSSIIRSTRLLLIFKNQYLDDDVWWIENYKQHFQYLDNYFGISENGRELFRKNSYKIIPDDLIHFINVSLYSSLFSNHVRTHINKLIEKKAHEFAKFEIARYENRAKFGVVIIEAACKNCHNEYVYLPVSILIYLPYLFYDKTKDAYIHEHARLNNARCQKCNNHNFNFILI
jgi:hypothetical protein